MYGIGWAEGNGNGSGSRFRRAHFPKFFRALQIQASCTGHSYSSQVPGYPAHCIQRRTYNRCFRPLKSQNTAPNHKLFRKWTQSAANTADLMTAQVPPPYGVVRLIPITFNAPFFVSLYCMCFSLSIIG